MIAFTHRRTVCMGGELNEKNGTPVSLNVPLFESASPHYLILTLLSHM